MKILIADQHHASRRALRLLLEVKQHEVLDAADGQAALGLAHDRHPDLIILNILMPVMDGFRFCQAAREYRHLRDVPFVLYSSTFISEEDRRLAAEMGAFLVIEKPAQADKFVALVEQLPAIRASYRPPKERTLQSRHVLSGLIGHRLDDKLNELSEEVETGKRTLNSLIKNLPGMIYRCRNDRKFTMEFVSDGCMALTGFSAYELVGKHAIAYTQLIPEVERERVRAEIQTAVQNGEAYQVTYPLKNRDGRMLMVTEHGAAVVSGEDGGDELEGYVWDISEQYSAELRRKRFFDITQDLLVIANLKGYFVQLSASCSQLLGWSNEELMERPWISFIHPQDRDSTLNAEQEVIDGQHVLKFENRFVCKNGSYRSLNWNCFSDIDAGLVYTVARDVTGDKINEMKYSRLSEALRQTMVPMTLQNNQLGTSFANRAFSDLFGPRMAGVEAEKMILPPAHTETVRTEDLLKILSRQDSWQGEVIRQTDEGELLPLNLSITALQDSRLNRLGYVTSYTDLRPVKKSELLRIQALTDTIASIARMVEMRDPFTAGHQQRVSELAVAIATEMKLGAHEIEGIRLGSLIHDIGKITIPVEVLNKPDRLTEEEFQVIKTHPGVGSQIVADIEFEWPIMEIINQHHERLDGSGYPHGLKQEEICLEARIVGVADIIEAMTAQRHHRQGQNIEQALEQIQSQSASGLDSAAVDACLRVFHEHNFQWSKLSDPAPTSRGAESI